MIKWYKRICLAPDDTSIQSPELTAEDLADFVDALPTETAEETPSDESSTPEESASEESTSTTEETASDESTSEDTGSTEEETTQETGDTTTTQETTTGATETTPELSELDVLRAQVEKLTKVIGDLSAGPKAVTPEVAKKEEEVKAKTLQELADTIDFDEVMQNKENFVKFLLEFANTIKSETTQGTLQALPNVVGSVVRRQSALNDVARDFYSKNKDLIPVKAYVGKIANEVSAANPDYSIEQVLNEAATKARDTLGLIKAAKTVEKKAAALPGSKGVRQQVVKPTGLQKEIDDFLTD